MLLHNVILASGSPLLSALLSICLFATAEYEAVGAQTFACHCVHVYQKAWQQVTGKAQRTLLPDALRISSSQH